MKKRPVRSSWNNPGKGGQQLEFRCVGQLNGYKKYLGLCENVLRTLDEKYWLGKGVEEESQVTSLASWANYGVIH